MFINGIERQQFAVVDYKDSAFEVGYGWVLVHVFIKINFCAPLIRALNSCSAYLYLFACQRLLIFVLIFNFQILDSKPAELEELMYCPATLNTIWKLVEIPFRHMVRIGVRFFRRVPGRWLLLADPLIGWLVDAFDRLIGWPVACSCMLLSNVFKNASRSRDANVWCLFVVFCKGLIFLSSNILDPMSTFS